MSDVLFTCAGQIGDDLFRFPIAYQYSKQHSTKVDVALWEGSKCLLPLLEEEDWVDNVFTSPGITGCPLGGQPWDFGRDEEWRSQYKEIYHLGYRRYPYPRINNTMECLETSGVPISTDGLLTEPCLLKYKYEGPKNLALHMDASCDMRNTTSTQTILPVLPSLRSKFNKCYLLGLHFDRWQYQTVKNTYPDWVEEVHDEGDIRVTASILKSSLLLGTYGSMWALMNCIKGSQVVIMDQDFISAKGNKISDPRVERLVVVGNSQGVTENIEDILRG